MDRHFPPINIPSQAQKMVEEVVGGGNVVEEASDRFRMERVGFHILEKRDESLAERSGR
jgi:hypothetical protein